MRRVLATTALAFLTAVVLSCAGSKGTVKDAEKARALGKYDEAHAYYANLLKSGKADLLTRQKADVARERARDAHLDEAMRHLARADFAAAKPEVVRADRISPNDPIVKNAAEMIESRAAWFKESGDRARNLLDMGRGDEAASVLAELDRAFPAADFSELNARAKRIEDQERINREAAERRRIVGGVLNEAEAAWRRGQAGEAVEALERGRARVGEAAELMSGAATIRSGTAGSLLARARAELAAGRAATALLFARAALRADPTNSGARGVERDASGRMETSLALSLRLARFTDDTRGRADPATFARRILALSDIPFTRMATSLEDPDYVVNGRIKMVNVTKGRPKVESRTHQYVAGSDFELNPEYEARRERVDDLRDEYDDAADIWRALKDERDELERLRGSAATVRNNRRYYGAYEEARFQRLLADSRTRETTARRERDRAAKALGRAERRLDGVPYYLEKKVMATAGYRERTQTVDAEASATVDVRSKDGNSGTASPVAAKVSVSDRGADAVPAAGLAYDPIDLPSDAEMSDRVLEELAGRAAEAIAVEIARARLEIVSEARRLEAAGRAEDALDRHAAFLLATEGRLPLERASSARRIRDAFGIDLTGESMDLSRLRLD